MDTSKKIGRKKIKSKIGPFVIFFLKMCLGFGPLGRGRDKI